MNGKRARAQREHRRQRLRVRAAHLPLVDDPLETPGAVAVGAYVAPVQATAAMEAASDWDRAYFAAHLGRDRYVRRRLPREFGAREDDPAFPATATHVEVQQVRPGFRLRRAIQVLERRSYPTGAIPWEHAEAFIDSALTRGGK
jgi:hypothetical protein